MIRVKHAIWFVRCQGLSVELVRLLSELALFFEVLISLDMENLNRGELCPAARSSPVKGNITGL